jgi:transmembrane sensor
MDRIWILMARRLAGEITPAEQLELDNLLRNNPDIHYPLETISDTWKEDTYPDPHHFQQDEPDPETEEAWAKHLERLGQAGPPAEKRSRRNLLPAAFITSLVLILIYVTRPGAEPPKPSPEVREVSTKSGDKTRLVLPDGSRVWLNANSKLTYGSEYGKEKREVQLTGEAFFDVEKDSARPFLIHTPNMDLKVLGTSFNVKSYPGEATSEASLITGSLEISLPARNKQKIVLQPNEKLVVANEQKDHDKDTSSRKSHYRSPSLVSIKNITHFEKDDSIIVETSWVQNKLVFQEEKFRDIALKMEKWYAVSININDRALQELQFTGIFETETIRQALYALSLTEPFTYSIKNDTISIAAINHKQVLQKK